MAVRLIDLADLVDLVADRRRQLARPLIMAIDGRGATGKSTLAAYLAERIDAVVIDGDDFYRSHRWAELEPADRADRCIDWQAQREVLEALRRSEPTRWRAYDWDADDGRLEPEPTTMEPSPVVILEGTFSARPELADLLDMTTMLAVSPEVQRARFIGRESAAEWQQWSSIWMPAEDHYFTNVMPPERFDVVVSGGSG